MDQDRAQIDKIIYLASLGSSKEEIDAKMDTLRVVTAMWQPGIPLEATDRQKLIQLEDDLKQYLISHDPLRNFTLESLNMRVQSHNQTKKGFGFVTLALLSFIAPLLVFVVPPYTLSFEARTLLSIPIFFASISTEIAIVYFSALRGFKPQLKRVIVYQCIAAVTMALALLFYVPMQFFNWSQLPFFQYGGLPWGGGVCMFFLYLAMRHYAKLLNLKSRYMSVLGLMAAITLVVVIGRFLPLVTDIAHEGFFRITITGMMVLASFCAFGAGIAWSILHAVTPAYARSLRVTHAFLVMCCVFGVLFAGFLTVTGELFATNLTYAMLPSAGPPMLLLLYCAYSFKKETGR